MDFSQEQLAFLRLVRTPGIGPVGLKRLLMHYQTAAAALAEYPRWRRPTQPEQPVGSDVIAREQTALQRHNARLLLWDDPAYPPALAQLPDPPPTLTVLGNAALLSRRQVALVGNRNASAAALAWTTTLAGELATAGMVITSGMARGIDTAAHEGALAANGTTIAVLGGGADVIYPPENRSLHAAIAAGGAVVSEQPLGMPPTAQLFPRRNRVIAGLALGVVVGEATRHSGSLITAQYALDYGREVWAVPGNPADARAGGPNWLLKQGATLVEGSSDILATLPATAAPYVPKAPPAAPTALPGLLDTEDIGIVTTLAEDPLPTTATVLPPRTRLYGLLGSQPSSADDLLRASGLPEHQFTALLVELELEGHAVRDADGRWRRG